MHPLLDLFSCTVQYICSCLCSLHAGEFELSIEAGSFTESEIVVMLGENGTGKTTFIRMLAGKLEPDDGGAPAPTSRIRYP